MIHWARARCLQGHVILGCCQEDESAETMVATLVTTVQSVVSAQVLNPWCGLCGSPIQEWTYDVVAIEAENFADVVMMLKAWELKEHAYANVLKGAGMAHDQMPGALN